MYKLIYVTINKFRGETAKSNSSIVIIKIKIFVYKKKK